MDKSVQITSIVVAGIIIVALIGYLAINQINPNAQNTITVQGIASVKTTPDLVTVYFNVETRDSDMNEASQKNAEIVDDLNVGLIKLGLEKKQIQTESFSVNPDYRWNNGYQTQNGYVARHSIRIELSTEDTSLIGDIIDAGVESGAAINYINYELSQDVQNELKAKAMKLAAEDAKIKAESVAEGSGSRLGKLVSISVNDFAYYPWRLYSAEAGAMAQDAKVATTNIQPSDKEISATVSVVYKIY